MSTKLRAPDQFLAIEYTDDLVCSLLIFGLRYSYVMDMLRSDTRTSEDAAKLPDLQVCSDALNAITSCL